MPDETPSTAKPVDMDQVIDRTVRRVHQDAISSKYVECPGCGNLILRKYGECQKCDLRYNPQENSWTSADFPKDEDAADDSPTTFV
jgi:predicted RNA-binding Zn-ribbon protein involved in translation (DUF1610 family)